MLKRQIPEQRVARAANGSRPTLVRDHRRVATSAVTTVTMALLVVTGCGAPATGPNVAPEERQSVGQAPSEAAGGAVAAGADAVDVPDYEIVTVLARDGIPAIDRPEYWTVEEANEAYADDELVIGVAIDGEARAYSLPFLSGHEIVNDTVGGTPISVTW